MMKANGNTDNDPRPPVPPVVPPNDDSIYNVITRRIRRAKTIFGDRVKLVLRQVDESHWSKLQRPYLLVVPRQVRQPRELDVDYMSFVNPREVTFIAQFDARGSEQEYMAANDMDTAERQLIYVLAKWQPQTLYRGYKPTLYGGCRIQATRAPDVKVHYIFVFNEVVIRRDDVVIDEELEELVLDHINVNAIDPNCLTCAEEAELPPGPEICVTGGGCPEPPEVDPCAPPPCPPILGSDDDASAPASKG